MFGWGITLIALGLGSFLLNKAGMEFILFVWVDTWGETVGTAIRLGVAAVGAVLILSAVLKSKSR